MQSEELRGLQAPLKERYRQHPEATIITLKAPGRVGEGASCRVETAEQLATLMRLTERYCVVYQMLRQPPEVLV